jgi:integrase
MTRPQKGYLYKAYGAWHVRYRENVWQKDGTTKRMQLSKRVATLAECPRKGDAWVLAQQMLSQVNSDLTAGSSTMLLGDFLTTVYLPYVQTQKRPSTFKGYRDIWERHLKSRLEDVRIREFRTWDGERLMQSIASTTDLTGTSLRHIKAVLSGIFTHARRTGALDGVNPMQGVSIPKAREPEDTYAYSLDEIYRMLTILPDPAATVIATAAFTGLRKGELRGIRWDHYTGTSLSVMHSVWNRHVGEPKTRTSKAPVPVIRPVAVFLERYRSALGNPQTGWIFATPKGRPLHIDNLTRRTIQPALKGAGIEWHGWHAFRRGLATNLQRLGVPIKVAQAILRHAEFGTTANLYVKTVDADAVEAMAKLETECNDRAMAAFAGLAADVVN